MEPDRFFPRKHFRPKSCPNGMKYDTHKLEIIDYLHAKFQFQTTTLSLDFKTGIWVGRTPPEVNGVNRYGPLGHKIDNRCESKHDRYSFESLPVETHPVMTLNGQKPCIQRTEIVSEKR